MCENNASMSQVTKITSQNGCMAQNKNLRSALQNLLYTPTVPYSNVFKLEGILKNMETNDSVELD